MNMDYMDYESCQDPELRRKIQGDRELMIEKIRHDSSVLCWMKGHKQWQ